MTGLHFVDDGTLLILDRPGRKHPAVPGRLRDDGEALARWVEEHELGSLVRPAAELDCYPGSGYGCEP